ncbi:MAG: hypothetical protein ACYTG2_06335 [Planctomycetota bacterium]
MHYLTRQRLHLSRFHPLMRTLLSLYVISVLAAMWVTSLKYTDRADWSAEGVRLYIQGDAAAVGDPFGDPFAGTPDGSSEHPGMSRRQIIDIVHPHLFTVPIVLFILGHLLHLTRLPDVLKALLNIAVFVACLGTFLLPLAVRGNAWLSPVLIVCGTLLVGGVVLQCAVLLYETWFGRPGRGFDAMPRQGP